MKLAICGCGVVGRATGEGFARLGHEVFTYDINPEAAKVPWGTPLERPEPLFRTDLVFICTPEEFAFQATRTWPGRSDVIVVRSSTAPGTVGRLYSEYGCLAVHNPEFLREATALQDFLSPSFILLGIPDRGKGPWVKVEQMLSRLYEPFRAPIVITDPTTSEMVKLATNGLLATLTAYWMDIDRLCQELGVNSHQVGMIASLDPRVPIYGARRHNRYGGHCLPKDIQALIRLARDLGRDVPILTAAATWTESV